jgi:hypothetical protein
MNDICKNDVGSHEKRQGFSVLLPVVMMNKYFLREQVVVHTGRYDDISRRSFFVDNCELFPAARSYICKMLVVV